MKVVSPKSFFEKINGKFYNSDYVAMLISVISGVLIHFHIISSRVTNPDVIWESPYKHGHAWEIALGRWALGIVDYFKHNLVLPVWSMVLTILLLTVISILLIKYLNIQSMYSKIIIVLLLQSFPMIAETLTYFYCSDSYMISFLLSIISVMILGRGERQESVVIRYIVSSVLLTFSLGIYQSFVGVYIVCASITLMNMLLWSENSLKRIFVQAFRYVTVLVVSLILYFVISMLMRNYYGIETASYRGMNNMFNISVTQIPYMIANAYTVFFRYFLDNYIFNNPWWGLDILYICCFVLIICFVAFKIIKDKIYRDAPRVICIIVLLILMPMLFCAIVFLASNTTIAYLMLPQMVLLFVWLVYLAEHIQFPIFSWCVVLVCTIILINWIQLDNAMYNAMEIEYDKTYALGARIVENIEEYPDFDYSKPIAIIGYVDNARYPDLYAEFTTSVYNTVGTTGFLWQNSLLVSQTSWYHFFQRYYGVTFNYCNSESELNEIYLSEEYSNMNYFPSENSIREINGVIVVKLSDI